MSTSADEVVLMCVDCAMAYWWARLHWIGGQTVPLPLRMLLILFYCGNLTLTLTLALTITEPNLQEEHAERRFRATVAETLMRAAAAVAPVVASVVACGRRRLSGGHLTPKLTLRDATHRGTARPCRAVMMACCLVE